ncbi:MAG: hypothetical protein FJY88_02195 [Candidatus Eisenbacteria bacterium]|nr:hypothetical protein [Candidatus Eisenbacteria bacterium]
MDGAQAGASFFDVDKTLLPGVSVEMLLVRGLLRRTIPGRFRWLPFLLEGSRLLPRGLTVARKANKGYLAGFDPAQVREWAEALFDSEIEPRLGIRGKEWVAWERALERKIVLLTGMPTLLLGPIARHFGADFAIGTEMELDARGRLTGRRAGPHPYGRTKLDIASRLALEHGWDPRGCSAYADHWSDAHLLRWVGEPFAVDPDDRLRREAERRGWKILRHELTGQAPRPTLS